MSEQAATVTESPVKDENQNKDTPVRIGDEIFDEMYRKDARAKIKSWRHSKIF